MDKHILITGRDIGKKVEFEEIEFPVVVVDRPEQARNLRLQEGVAYFVNPAERIKSQDEAWKFGGLLYDACGLEKSLAIISPLTLQDMMNQGYHEIDKLHSFVEEEYMHG
jgi:hypothetical protein